MLHPLRFIGTGARRHQTTRRSKGGQIPVCGAIVKHSAAENLEFRKDFLREGVDDPGFQTPCFFFLRGGDI